MCKGESAMYTLHCKVVFSRSGSNPLSDKSFHRRLCMYTVSQKSATFIFAITVANVDRF